MDNNVNKNKLSKIVSELIVAVTLRATIRAENRPFCYVFLPFYLQNYKNLFNDAKSWLKPQLY